MLCDLPRHFRAPQAHHGVLGRAEPGKHSRCRFSGFTKNSEVDGTVGPEGTVLKIHLGHLGRGTDQRTMRQA
jgi:hypothetical protein